MSIYEEIPEPYMMSINDSVPLGNSINPLKDTITFDKTDYRAVIPTLTASGYDLYSLNNYTIVGNQGMIPIDTGVRIYIFTR